MRPRERARASADVGVPEWREQATWRRTARARGRTGALDLPGRPGRDRPANDRGDGVFLAGNMAAAPGMRGEISVSGAVRGFSGGAEGHGGPGAPGPPGSAPVTTGPGTDRP